MRLDPVGKIKADLGIDVGGRVQQFFTDTCYKHMDKYVPKDSGVLRDTAYRGIDYITYETPYAHAQYIGYTKGPVRNYTTPGTGPYWDQRMVSAEMDIVVKEVQDYVRRS